MCFKQHPLSCICSCPDIFFFYTVIAQGRAPAFRAKSDILALVEAIHLPAARAFHEAALGSSCLAVVASPTLLAHTLKAGIWSARFADVDVSG